eukprot:7233332-Prymnesium_polylepis.3
MATVPAPMAARGPIFCAADPIQPPLTTANAALAASMVPIEPVERESGSSDRRRGSNVRFVPAMEPLVTALIAQSMPTLGTFVSTLCQLSNAV